MGTDKALLQLGGKPLVEHAVIKLRRICASVKIVSGNAELEGFAPLVADERPGCGPLGGIAAALYDSEFAWNLILPVDIPFVRTEELDDWLWTILHRPIRDFRLSMLAVNGKAHPALLIVHRDVAPYLRDALRRGEYRLLAALEGAAEAIARERGVKVERVFARLQYDDCYSPAKYHADKAWKAPHVGFFAGLLLLFSGKIPAGGLSEDFVPLWNLNTPEDFARAERFVDKLDTSGAE